MRKQIFLTVLIIVILVTGVKLYDLTSRYDIGVGEYLKYSMPLTTEEKEYLNANTIYYGIDIDDAPYVFVSDDTNQNSGIMVDYFNQLSVTLESDFQPVVTDDYNIAIQLKNKRMDASVLNQTEINKSVFLFTQTLYKERSKILVDGESAFDSIYDISDVSLAVVSGSTAHHVANRFFEPQRNVRLVLTENLEETFQLFEDGEVDGIIGDEAKISYSLNHAIRRNQFKFLEGAVSEENVAVAVNKDQILLFNILNKGILEMKKSNQYNHINSKWFGSFIPETQDYSANANVLNFVIFAIVISAFFTIWNQTVTNEVNIKTRELKASQHAMRELIDSLPDGVIVYGSDETIQAANMVVARLLGMSIPDLIGKKVSEIQALKPFMEHINEKTSFGLNNRYYLVSQKDLNDSSPENLLTIVDYTEQYIHNRIHRQEAKMIAVGELSAGLAHEIRNPLGLIKSYSYILNKKAEDDTSKHAIKVVNESVDRINKLIENLLGFSRLSADKAQKTKLCESVNSAVALAGKDLEKAGVQVEVEAEDVTVNINEDVLRLCIVNLINNSVDAFRELAAEGSRPEEGCRVDIRCVVDEEQVKVSFRDNAGGIPPENLETVFNPFFTTKETGTGLGLYILQSEIDRVGGKISVESTPGKGTEFSFSIPVESADKSRQA